MSIRIKDIPPKTGQVTNTTKLATEDANDELDKTRMMPASDITPYTYASSDEDSPLSTGIVYTTEAISVLRNMRKVVGTLKTAPTGSSITVDVLKETGTNTDVFVSIFSTLLTIEVNEFTSQTAAIQSAISAGVWEEGRRLQIKLTVNDSNFTASGLKVTIKS